MKHIILSNHTADRLNQKEVEREKLYRLEMKLYEDKCKSLDMVYKTAVDSYENAVSVRKKEIEKSTKKFKDAWAKRYIWQSLKSALEIFYKYSSNKPSKPIKPRYPYTPIKAMPSEEDRIWESGKSGEQQVHDYLQRQLSDDWTLLSGYKNHKGEIDKILIGTEGIFAIEIKNINGSIYCNGDKWWKDKYDKYGNLVELNVPIQDRRGRSPSQQLNEPANILQTFLRRTLLTCQIHRIVVFTHESSEIEDLSNFTVNEVIILKKWDLKCSFEKNTFKMTMSDIDKMVNKIEANHQHVNNRSKQHS